MNTVADDRSSRHFSAQHVDLPEHGHLDPPPMRQAAPRVLASARKTVTLLLSRRLHHPRRNVGRLIHFADGSRARVYREPRVGDGEAHDPTLLVVGFVLRGVRGPLHTAFRVESWLNIPMFVGFPGFTSKLWLAHDGNGCYRGIYEWDDAEQAAAYVRNLSWVLGLVSVPGSIRAHIIPGIHRDDALAHPEIITDVAKGTDPWWRPVPAPE